MLRTLVTEPQTRWLVRLRVTEWWCNTRRSPLGRAVGVLLRLRFIAHSRRMGYTIPLNIVDAGLRLPHYGTIAVSGGARVGRNCQILHGVTLAGTAKGAPVLEDDVFVGPGATVLGPVRVGAGALIGANSLVTKDVPAGATVLASPAEPRVLDLRRAPAVSS
ncbi:serine acetyltransferase [Motilibacter rhizosphaerae]|uniref:serine acetyltransferase n=1 Tax=Motilibacter rhizosphaerae TaxID=598652 RepID=UPI00102CEF87|nr:serine acetyltransferase [Motilibacter rhizosphaerae]